MPSSITHLYAHVPFCSTKCPYCAFVTHVGSLKLLEPYLDALKREAALLALARPGGPLHTVYFGGGTPSLMSPAQLADLLDHVDRVLGLASGCEITLEAHPVTVDLDKLRGFRQAGATRISYGGESLNPMELQGLGRTHTPEQVLEMVQLARQAGFDSVNVDLMYGVPGQTLRSWAQTLRRVLSARPDHLSLYPLSIEPRTVFARRWRQKTLDVPADEAVAEMYHLACRRLGDAGYVHYEVANWALPGHHCRHNLAYWHNREFYAIGVGAHGYLKPYRTENMRQTRRYIERIRAGESAVESSECVDPSLELAETVMLRLRLLSEGLDLEEIRRSFGVDLEQRFASDLVELTAAGLLCQENGKLLVPESAVPIANEVWQRFV